MKTILRSILSLVLVIGKLSKIGLIFDQKAKSRRPELLEFRSAAFDMGIAYKIKLIENKVAQGAISAFASDYYIMVDECLIPMAIDVLKKGINPGDMPVRFLEKPYVYLNLTQAKKLGLVITDEIKKKAVKTF